MYRNIAASALAVTLLAMPSAALAQAPAASAENQVQKAPLPQRASVTKAPVAPRAYIGVDAGYQGAARRASNTYSFPLYQEAASVTGTYAPMAGTMFNVGGGYRVWRNLMIGGAISRYGREDPIAISARVPAPFFFNQFRNTEGTSRGAARAETAIHLQAMWMIAASSRTQVGLFAGPSLFSVTQAVLVQTNFTDAFPYDTVAVGNVVTSEQSSSRTGYNLGTDVTYVMRRSRTHEIGVGGLVRFSRASVSFTDASKHAFSVQAGGLQVGGGLRLRF